MLGIPYTKTKLSMQPPCILLNSEKNGLIKKTMLINAA